MTRIAIVGYGKMGRAVAAQARDDGDQVVAELDIGDLAKDRLGQAQVAVEFTEPAAAVDNLCRLASFGLPAVCGTTGWYDRLPQVRQAVEKAGTALVYAPNFSVGVQLLLHLARTTGAALANRPEFDAYLVETHHNQKKDAPSGTAAAMRDALRGADPAREYPITSVRAGQVPGTHELHLEAAGESITLTHVARDRVIFARGALIAARWLVAKPRRGLFTFDQVLFGDRESGTT